MILVRLLAVVGAVGLIVSAAFSQSAKPPTKVDLNQVNLETAALQEFYQLQLTEEQLQLLARLARETAPAKPRNRPAAKASEAYRKTLLELRDALARDDADAVEEVSEKLAKLYDAEPPTLDDGIDLTDAARRRVPELLRSLSPRQVADYLGYLDEEELDDPVELALATLEDAVRCTPEEWKNLRDTVAEEIGWKVAGLDAAAGAKLAERVAAFLDRAHRLKEAELQKGRSELEKSLRLILGPVSPFDILRHVVEHRLAELLSNPQLSAAIERRLQNIKK